MINKIKNSILILLVFVSFTACQKDDVVEAKVDVMVAEPGDLLNKSFPLRKVRVEGEGLSDLQQIILDNRVNVSFNPTYNSDKSFIFTVPFDITQGSRFGVQPITFITRNGSVTKNFEILRPLPVISGIAPETPLVGQTATVNGDWFYDVTSVTFGGNQLNYTVNSATSITITIPDTATTGADLVVTTPSGSATRFMDVSLGFTIVNVTDFDGGGTRPGSGWFSYGDVASFITSATGGPTGNHAEFSWTGSTANGYNGSSGGPGAGAGVSFLSSTSTDASKGFIDMDVSANVVGAHFSIQLNTIDGVNYGYRFKITDLNWSTKTLALSDFVDNYGFGNPTGANINPSKINEIKIGVDQGDTPNPTTIKFDNIKIKYME